jgi:hypothetical protein
MTQAIHQVYVYIWNRFLQAVGISLELSPVKVRI